MKTLTIILFSLLVSVTSIWAQSDCQAPKKFMDTCNDIFEKRESNPDEGLIRVTRLITEGLDNKVCEKYMATAYSLKGVLLKNLLEFEQAQKSYVTALELRKQLGDSLGVAKIYNNSCTLYKAQGKYDLAIPYCDTCIVLLEQLSNDDELAKVNINKANIFIELKDVARARPFLEKAEKLLERDPEAPQETITTLRYNYAIALINEKQYQEALGILDSCLQYYNSVEDNFNSALVEKNKGIIYLQLEQYDEARRQLKKSKAKDEAFSQNLGIINELITKLEDQNSNNQDIENIKEALVTALGDPSEEEVLLFRLENDLHKKELEDSLFKEGLYKKGILCLFLIIIISILGIYFFYQERKKAEKKRIEAELEAEENKMYAKVAKTLKLYKEKVERVIHDEACRGAVNAKREIELYNLKNGTQILDKAKEFCDYAYSTARALIGEEIRGQAFGNDVKFLPNNIYDTRKNEKSTFTTEDGRAFILTILEHSEQMKYFKVNKHIGAAISTIAPNIIKQLMVITDVLLDNIEKHAQANTVHYNLNLSNEQILFKIQDNGCGFDTQQKPKGIGLKNVAHRVKHILKGQLHINSTLGKGTIITIQIPV